MEEILPSKQKVTSSNLVRCSGEFSGSPCSTKPERIPFSSEEEQGPVKSEVEISKFSGGAWDRAVGSS